MIHRELRLERGISRQLATIGISYQRFDSIMEYINEVLATMPEAFPVIPNTRISICLTNEFVGDEYSSFPSLAIYFHFDHQTVTIISVEKNMLESYGL